MDKKIVSVVSGQSCVVIVPRGIYHICPPQNSSYTARHKQNSIDLGDTMD
jgi:hypothetical protein